MSTFRHNAVEDFAQCIFSLARGRVFCVHEMHGGGGGLV